jgi:hypothetical protein
VALLLQQKQLSNNVGKNFNSISKQLQNRKAISKRKAIVKHVANKDFNSTFVQNI